MSANYNCDGSGPHQAGEVRVYPLGAGGNLILCAKCWQHENRYRRERQREGRMLGHSAEAARNEWPEESWDAAKVYGED